MYSESLITPHPYKHDGQENQQPLHVAARLDTIREGLESMAIFGDSILDEARIDAAQHIAKAVNRALWFPIADEHRDDFAHFGLPKPLSLETIYNAQAANCYGYTLVTSECLEAADIPHWIAYANGHAFNVLPTTNNRLYLLDSLSPQLNQFLDEALEVGTKESAERDIKHHGRAAMMLNTLAFGGTLGTDTDTLSHKYPWLTTDSALNSITTKSEKTAARYRSKYRLIMSVFEPSSGRGAIENYAELEYAISVNNTDRACMLIENMSGYFPEIDARQDHSQLRTLVTALSPVDPERAIALVEEYFSSNFKLTSDSRILEAKGDMLRKIAKAAGNSRAAELAANAYHETLQRPKSFRSAILGKLAVATSLKESLSSDRSS